MPSQNDLFRKNHAITGNIRAPFAGAKDREVTPAGSPTSVSTDRAGSQTGAPVEILPDNYTNGYTNLVNGTPLQSDGTLLTKVSQNVSPGPDSRPWWRRDIDAVNNGRESVILTITVPEGKVYHLKRIGHTFWSAQDEYWITYDDKLLNDAKWAFPLGTPANLFEMRCAVAAVKEIKCHVRNNSGAQRNYEFMVEGWYDDITFSSGSRTN